MANPIPSDIKLTGTGLDQIIEVIFNDDGLNTAFNPAHQDEKVAKTLSGAHAAADMNVIIADAIKATGVASDGSISANDVVTLNTYLRSDADLFARFTADHGSDAGGVDTGFEQIMCGGSVTLFKGQKLINKPVTGLYHLASDIQGDHFVDDDGSASASLQSVANTLNYFYLGLNVVNGTGGNDILHSGVSDDRFVGSENETFKAGAGNDIIRADAGNDVLYGEAGNDRLLGGTGADKLVGGTGADVMDAGVDSERDTLVFAKGDSGLTAKTVDRIVNFHSGQDKIDLTALGHLHFAGAQFDGHGPEVIQRGATLLIDHTGDGRPDMAIQLLGNVHVLAGDFVFA